MCAYIYVCLAECSHLFMCNHVLSECSCCRGFVLQLKAEEGKFVSGDGEARAEAGLSDPSHKHFPYSCRITSTLEVFGSLINPVKRTPECFCKVRRVIYLPLFVKSS